LVGLIASYWLFVPMIAEVAPADLVRMELGLTATFLIFVGATTLFHLLWRRLPNNLDMGLMSLNALAFFGSTYLLLWDDYRPWFGFIALALSLFYGLVGYGALKRSGAPPQVALFALAIALVFLTVAAPLQLSGSWITVAWAAEGAVLVWVGFLLGTWQARAFGLGVLAIALARLLLIDTFVYLPAFRLFFNDRFPTFVVGIAAFYAAGYLYHRWRGVVQEWEGQMGLFLLGVANLLTLWILSAEAIRYFDARALAALPSPRRAYLDAENGKLLALTVLWGVYALGLLALAQARGSRYLRWAGLALLALAVGKFVLVDTLALNVDPAAFHPAFNYPFATFLVLLAVVIFAAFLVAKRRDTLLPGEAYALPVLVVAANVLAIWAFSVEAWRYFDSREYLLRTDMDSAKHLTLTVLWAIYAVGVIVVGFVARSNTIRLAGLALLAIPVVKLFAFDVFLLERGYRVAAFVTLGVLLLGTGLAYQRYSGAIRGFLFSKGSPEARDDA
ncbi:MAG: DUF2339 domain-containing protein, partial [Chloroflexi bacterium]|nr:DUF2339 domain-containing protein [Chloroflexota bacterium]